MFSYLERALGWLKDGYPQGIPTGDYIPLVALLKRRLTADEITVLGEGLSRAGLIPADHIDVGTGYLKLTDELPSVEELDRVTVKLHEAGWWIEDDQWRNAAGDSLGSAQVQSLANEADPDEGPGALGH